MSIHVKNDKEFIAYATKVSRNKERKYLVIKFSAKWCGPCKKIQPLYNQLAASCSNAFCLSVDVDECKEAAERFAPTALPTFLVVANGNIKGTLKGANPAGLQKMFSSVNSNSL